MKTAFAILAFCCVSACAAEKTNFVYVVNDDSVQCQSSFDAGMMCGGLIAAGLFVLWMIRTIPGRDCE